MLNADILQRETTKNSQFLLRVFCFVEILLNPAKYAVRVVGLEFFYAIGTIAEQERLSTKKKPPRQGGRGRVEDPFFVSIILYS